MSCVTRILGFQIERHDWQRKVTHTESWTARGTDMWSQAIPVAQVACHTQYVCTACGAVRDGEECGCDKSYGDHCPPRLALLAEQRKEATSGATTSA